MLIRSASATDAGGISRLLVPLVEKSIVPDCTREGAARLLESMAPEAISQYIEQGFRYHVAEHEEEIVGAVGMRDGNHLFHLFVAEAHQGRGLARALWERAMKSSLASGSCGPFTVNSSLKARTVYERLGFRADSGHFTRDGVTFVPMTLDTR